MRLKAIAILYVVLFTGSLSANPSTALMFPPLTEPATGQMQPGKFIWADLFSADVDASIAFYTNVFGWKVKETGAARVDKNGEIYYHLLSKGKPVAGIVSRPTVKGETDKALWVGHISTQNVQAAVNIAENLGAKVSLKPRQFGQRGTHAIITDPQGGIVGFLSSDSGDPRDEDAVSGEWSWAQLFSINPNAAMNFYSEVIGYEVQELPQIERENDFILSQDDITRVGIVPLPESFPQQDRWIGFVSIDNIDKTLRKAKEAGGKIIYAPRKEVFDSQLAIIADSNGALIGLIQKLDTDKVEK